MTTEKSIQDILNKLISEEWIASTMYHQFILAAKTKEDRHTIKELLHEISEDEMHDHYKKLVHFAVHNDFKVPCKIKDYEKYASKETVKQFRTWKENQDSEYYIHESIKAEEEAIASYEECMNSGILPQELTEILLPNYYDEIEHLEKLRTLFIVIKSGMEMAY